MSYIVGKQDHPILKTSRKISQGERRDVDRTEDKVDLMDLGLEE